MPIHRRQTLAALASTALASAFAQGGGKPIQLHCDLDVTPGKEKMVEKNFETTFRPTISRQPGFVDVKLLKFNAAKMGDGPKNASYRLVISFQTEAQRVTWVATPDHQTAWPTIENQLRGAKFTAWLYDMV
jgi:heme-degrading monooxygenase HmoA